MNEEKRAKLIKQFNLSDVFDSDGGLNAEYTAERGLNVYDGQAVGDEGNGGVKSLASGSKYVSRRIRYSSAVTGLVPHALFIGYIYFIRFWSFSQWFGGKNSLWARLYY